MIKWTSEHLTGIYDIDVNHEKLVKVLNEAYELFIIGVNVDELHIDELYNNMIVCFDQEEKWMAKTSYPDFLTHTAEHELFTIRFFEIRNSYEQNANNSVELLMFYGNYINHHVRETNRRFGSYIEAKQQAHKEHGNQVPEVLPLTWGKATEAEPVCPAESGEFCRPILPARPEVKPATA